MCPRARIIVSIHDVSPAWRDEVATAVDLVRDACGVSPALLVVPDFHWRARLSAAPGFIAELNRWIASGSELLLHGYSHLDDGPAAETLSRRLRARTLTAAEGEFLNLGPEAIRTRLQDGLAELACLSSEPLGFVPPAWLYNRHLAPVLSGFPLPFYEGHLYLHLRTRIRRIFAPALGFSARGRGRTAASICIARALPLLGARPGGLYRLAIHPVDLRSAGLTRALGAFFRRTRASVEWTSYAAVIGDHARRNG